MSGDIRVGQERPVKARRVRGRVPGPDYLAKRLWAALDEAHRLLGNPDPAVRLQAAQVIGQVGAAVQTIPASVPERNDAETVSGQR